MLVYILHSLMLYYWYSWQSTVRERNIPTDQRSSKHGQQSTGCSTCHLSAMKADLKMENGTWKNMGLKL